MKKLLILFLVATTFNVVAQQSVLLRANYNAGDTYLMTMEQSQKMGAQGGMDMKIVMEMSVTNKNQDTITAATSIKSIAMDMLQGGQLMSFDSTKSDDELDETGKMMKQQFDPMMKANIITKSNDRGEILDLTIEPMAPGMEQFTKQSGSIVFPEEAVSVGSTWSSENNQNGANIKTTYTVSKIESDKVSLDISGTVSGIAKGSVTGSSIIDVKTGMQSESNMDITFDMNGNEMKITTKLITSKK